MSSLHDSCSRSAATFLQDTHRLGFETRRSAHCAAAAPPWTGLASLWAAGPATRRRSLVDPRYPGGQRALPRTSHAYCLFSLYPTRCSARPCPWPERETCMFCVRESGTVALRSASVREYAGACFRRALNVGGPHHLHAFADVASTPRRLHARSRYHCRESDVNVQRLVVVVNTVSGTCSNTVNVQGAYGRSLARGVPMRICIPCRRSIQINHFN